MKFNNLFISSVSACFELCNTAPYYAEQSYDVELNGKKVLSSVKTNVFSLFDLEPDTEYEVSVGADTCRFKTSVESAALNVKDFGAKGDGKADDTISIQNAIICCPAGGRVKVEAGTYIVGPITLLSDITLELCEGAVLLGKTNESDYPVLPGEIHDAATGREIQVSTWEGDPFPCHQSFINAYSAHNIKVVGRGVIDGNAQNSTWWINPKQRKIGRPKLVFLNQCEDVIFHGITGRNSASWNLHPFFSKNISFYDTAVEAPSNSPNTDGSDPESCDHVNYIGVRFSVGDDAIAIKAGKMYMGMKYQTPADHHVIRNCLMEYAHGGVVLGSEMSGGVRNLTVSQCYFLHTDRGLRIKTRRGRGKYAIIDNMEFSNIMMDNVKTPFVINMYYFCDPDGRDEWVQKKTASPVDDTTPYIGSFVFKDIECKECEWAACYAYGLPEQPIKSVSFENISFNFKEDAGKGQPAMMEGCAEDTSRLGLYFNNVEKISLKNVSIEGQDGDSFIFENVGTKEIK
ncbi:MAG: glycoside hydrolase family 28 protein [Eubacteriales bacterium]|nr:glycoside hydrolase family 28 protein [Eubacteriales bacterium]